VNPDPKNECGHRPEDTNCQTWFCIQNILISASCDFKGDDWPCKKTNCDTTVDEGEWEVLQVARYTENCGSGEPVEPHLWVELWAGCESCGPHSYNSACDTDYCGPELEIWSTQERGTRRKCGCP